MHYINRGYDNNDNHNHKGRIEIEVAEKVRDPDPSLPEALLVLVRSGSGQVCGFDYLLPTTYDRLPTTAKNNEGSMLVERSMLTMRIERSICPLTSWMFATILVRRRLWPFLERLDLSQYWTLRNDFRMISYFRDEAEKVTSAAAACTLYLSASLHLAQEK